MKNKNNVIPIIFAADDNYAPILAVTIKSILDNANKKYFYKFYVLNTELNEVHKNNLSLYNTNYSNIEFISVKDRLNKINNKLVLRDYYTNTTYYRFFIPEMFPEYSKVMYLDSDLIVLGDISELYNTELNDNYVGAIGEEVMQTVKVFGNYVEKGLGIDVNKYFNAGVLVLNLDKLREIDLISKFINLISKYKFEVTQDQDYLNVICKDKAVLRDLGWNKTAVQNEKFNEENLKIIHYKLYYKPWLYKDVKYEEFFWEYAKKTPYYNQLINKRDGYDKKYVITDLIAYKNLVKLAEDYVKKEDTYLKQITNSI